MKNYLIKTIVFFPFFICICFVSCKKDITTINGKVTDSWTGAALANVSLSTDPDPSSTSNYYSDASGNYSITNLSKGNNTLYVYLDRYVQDTVKVSVTKGVASTVNISLNSVIGGTWSLSMPEGYTFQFKSDGSFTGNNGSGTWNIASLTTGIVSWNFNYYGSPITYYGRITSRTTMVGINVAWTATRQ